ncbi:uncharacterized protein LOC142175279 [Nicotiana tabacum]|uniref:Uncharacterized protein LOC142175279 n=1 Tax=Nicotiana tabacum TaxID=4097 RepID=A0AC58TL83_TOBAC
MTTSSKNIVAELNKGLKLNGKKYETWSLKVQYVLEEQEDLEAINNVMNEPEEGNTAQHRHEREAYDSWKKKNSITRITLLSTLDDDILREFKGHQRAIDLWNSLRKRFGTCSTARLRSLMIKFDSYKKLPKYSMKTHLRQMTNMIGELKDVGHVLTDEQQIQVVIRSLPSSWYHMKMHLTHNERITTLEDVRRHFELEEERLEAAKPIAELHMETTSKTKSDSNKRNWEKKRGPPQAHPAQHAKRAKTEKGNNRRPKRVKVAKVKCYNCDKKGSLCHRLL